MLSTTRARVAVVLTAFVLVSLFRLSSVLISDDSEVPQAACDAEGAVVPLFAERKASDCPIHSFLKSRGLLNDLCLLDNPGECSTVRKCHYRLKTCLNRVPLPCALSYTTRTAYGKAPVAKVVLTVAVGDSYGADWVTVFAGTLRRTGYDGLIAVVMDRLPTGLMAALYEALDVETVLIDLTSYPTSRLTAIRFLAYEEYLVREASRLRDALIFHCDSRDIYFQRDPFDFDWPSAVSGYPVASLDRSSPPVVMPFSGL